MKPETVQSVTEWADKAFGPATYMRQFYRAQEEMDELAKAVYTYAGLSLEFQRLPDENKEAFHRKIAEEAADVVICLYRIIGHYDPDAIEKKMIVNRARKWKVDGEGCAYHE